MLRTKDKQLFLGRELREIIEIPRPVSTETSAITTITANASANTKATSYTEIISSTSFDCDGFYVQVRSSTASRDLLFDIARGASSSEVDLIQNIPYTTSGVASIESARFYAPLYVPAGTRISARCQASTGSAAMLVRIIFVKGGHYRAMRCRRATTYGANTADSGGTSVDTGGVINTKGAWSELSSAITNPMKFGVLAFGNQVNGARTNTLFIADVGTGANPNEVVIFPDIDSQAEGNTDILRTTYAEFGSTVPAGTRLVVRAQCSITDATDRLFDATIIGFD